MLAPPRVGNATRLLVLAGVGIRMHPRSRRRRDARLHELHENRVCYDVVQR
jgi:hypothetical protein